jgi:hypothetical protein
MLQADLLLPVVSDELELGDCASGSPAACRLIRIMDIVPVTGISVSGKEFFQFLFREQT